MTLLRSAAVLAALGPGGRMARGARWAALGTYSFSAGWDKVQLSRWTTAGYVVVADAVRVR